MRKFIPVVPIVPSTLIALVASGALLGLAGWPATVRASEPAPVGTLAVDGSLRGEITSANRLNFSDGTRSAVVAIELKAGQAVSLQASGALCARLLVIHEGETVAGPNPAECHSIGGRSSKLVVMARQTGRHLIAVSGADARAYGPFRLEARALPVRQSSEPLKPGDDFADFFGGTEKTYRLDIAESGHYQIEMRSSDIDSVLELRGNGVSMQDDDGGGNLDARLRLPLEPGSYSLRAKASDDSVSGPFRLSVATSAMPAGVTLQNSGSLSTDGRRVQGLLAGTPREYELQVEQAGRVTIAMESDDFDTVLELRGNGVASTDDDGGRGTNSRLTATLQPGTYRVIARGLADDCNGRFTLSATVRPPRAERAPQAPPAPASSRS